MQPTCRNKCADVRCSTGTAGCLCKNVSYQCICADMFHAVCHKPGSSMRLLHRLCALPRAWLTQPFGPSVLRCAVLSCTLCSGPPCCVQCRRRCRTCLPWCRTSTAPARPCASAGCSLRYGAPGHQWTTHSSCGATTAGGWVAGWFVGGSARQAAWHLGSTCPVLNPYANNMALVAPPGHYVSGLGGA